MSDSKVERVRFLWPRAGGAGARGLRWYLFSRLLADVASNSEVFPGIGIRGLGVWFMRAGGGVTPNSD